MGKRANGEGTAYYDKNRQRWEAQVSYKDSLGNTKRKKFTGKTQREVNKKKAEWQKNSNDGLLPEADKLTVGVWVDRWLADFVKPSVRIKTYEKYFACMKYVKAKFGNALVNKLSVSDLQHFLNELLVSGGEKNQGLSASTVRGVRRYFIGCLEKGIKIGLLVKNPAKLTDPPRMVKEEIHPLNKEQARLLLDTARNKANDALFKRRKNAEMSELDVYIAVYIALSTGMRLGEVLGLKWEDIHFEQKMITVRRSRVATSHGVSVEEPKTGVARKIPIHDDLVKACQHHQKYQDWQKARLGDQYEDNGWVIGGSFGKNYWTNHFSCRKYKKLLVEAGINKSFTFHDLRHTHASLLLLDGTNPKIVQERLGHASIEMTLDTYSHLLPDTQNAAVQAVATFLVG
ncbi:Tyrosine recombinase XerC [Sporomusa silvacetica DSM 10669]|uniref:Tyrosine recombinase XerC n=1 Tax=Sporomusa silvacetica DSM 10669 TaxID=1123289 RepID=A0ABZ3ISI2_9FIRM|nr:tyrosine-type recombinase/integrase [Sporomusa silvacetica]OZC14653.1 transposase [Sporomusa silvacetica DSM 10669]